MKYLRTRFHWMTVLLVSLAFTLQSCDDIYLDNDWFGGRTFAAYAQPGSYNDLWVIEFYEDGQFSVFPCDGFGCVIPGMEIYEGNYSVDYDRGRLFMSYYGYSMISMWTFRWWDQYDPNTGTYPDMEIYTPSGYEALDNLVFTPY